MSPIPDERIIQATKNVIKGYQEMQKKIMGEFNALDKSDRKVKKFCSRFT